MKKRTIATLLTASVGAASLMSMAAFAETEIRTGCMASIYPYVFLDDDDNIVGYDVDMFAAIDELLEDYTFTFENLEYAVLFESLSTGAVDMLTGSINRTPERDEKYVTPAEDSGFNVCSLVVKSDNDEIKSLDDMGGKKLPFDPTRAEYATLVAWNEEHSDNPMVIDEMSDPSQADTMKMVADGREDAALIYRDSFNDIQEELGLDLKMLDEPATKLGFTQLINPEMEGAEELAEAISGALVELKENGTLSELSEKWLGFDMYAE